MNSYSWTKPYHGVTHLEIDHPWQGTVEGFARFSTGSFFNIQNGGWNKAKTEIFHGPDRIEQAKEYVEKQADLYNIKPKSKAGKL